MTAAAAEAINRAVRSGEGRQVDWVAYLFVAFFTVPFLLFNIGPILFGAYVAFTKWGIFGRPKWTGWENFATAFHDGFAIIAFKNTLLYGLIIVPSVTVIAFAFALYVNQRWPFAGLV